MANGNVFNAIYFADKQNAGTYIEKKDGNKKSEAKPYYECLNIVRSSISNNHASDLANLDLANDGERILKNLISKYINQNNLSCTEISDQNELTEKIFDDMAGFGILTSYIFNDTVEEININAWNDIEIVTSNGYRKIDESFNSPEEAVSMVKKMCASGDVTIDASTPVRDSYIFKGTRISAMIPPVIDEEIGTVASIRRQKKDAITPEMLINAGSVIKEELEFLSMSLNNGISLAIGGATGSGKTTFLGCLLTDIEDSKRIYTIEDSRELNLIKYDTDGKIINRVIHTKTNEGSNTTQTELLKQSLRQDPDIIVPAEMRGEEAWDAQEAGRTGHTIATSLHTNSPEETYTRILTLCQEKGTNLSEDLIMRMIMDAFPLVVFIKKLKDGTRRCMKIIEPTSYKDGDLKYHTIYQFVIKGWEKDETGKVKVKGEHKRVGDLSDKLAMRMLENGAELSDIQKYSPNFNPEKLEVV